MKVIIIGGGIGGLMTCIALNKKGIPSVIYEKIKSYDENGAGLALWANATSILDKVGLLNKLLSYGNILNEIKTFTSGGKYLNSVRLKLLENKFHFPSLVIQRKDLQQQLFNAIHSDQMYFNKQFLKVEKNGTIATVYFTDGTTATGDLVIFADGIHSLARKNIFNLPQLKYAGRTSWRGIASFEKPVFSNDSNLEIFGNGRRIGIFPLPGNRAYWYAAVNMQEQDALKQKRTIECIQSHFKGWADPVNILMQNTTEDRLILTKINYTTAIHKLVHENLALLGDSAHPMTPDLGQGACQAIEDAYVLADCLTTKKTIETQLRDYQSKRLKRVQSIAQNSYRVGKLRQLGNPVGVFIRNNIFKFMPERIALKMLGNNIDN